MVFRLLNNIQDVVLKEQKGIKSEKNKIMCNFWRNIFFCYLQEITYYFIPKC